MAKSTPEYEFYAELILTLFDLPPIKKITAEGITVISYWQALQKLLFNNFLKTLKAFDFDFLPERIFFNMSALIETNPRYNVHSASQVNPAIGVLLSWALGIYQHHRGSRPYSLSYTDRRDIGL